MIKDITPRARKLLRQKRQSDDRARSFLDDRDAVVKAQRLERVERLKQALREREQREFRSTAGPGWNR